MDINVEITSEMREAADRFESVRQSGVTNMYNRTLVCELAEITENQYHFILENYNVIFKGE